MFTYQNILHVATCYSFNLTAYPSALSLTVFFQNLQTQIAVPSYG